MVLVFFLPPMKFQRSKKEKEIIYFLDRATVIINQSINHQSLPFDINEILIEFIAIVLDRATVNHQSINLSINLS